MALEPDTKPLIFAGTPAFASHILGALIAANMIPELVLTQPDRPSGRGKKPQASPVKQLAETHGIRVFDPPSLKREANQAPIAAVKPAVMVVAAYGLILPQKVLDFPAHGALNVHASLLPRWRGAAPIERAIMAGDSETGVCIMQMEAGLDTGPVRHRVTVPITPTTTGASLEAELAQAGADALIQVLRNLSAFPPEPQAESGVVYAHKLEPADSCIDWTHNAAHIHRQIRALSGRQPAWTTHPAAPETRIRILEADLETRTAPTRPPGTLERLSRKALAVHCAGTDDQWLVLRRVALSTGKGTPMPAATAMNNLPALFADGEHWQTAAPQ